MSTSRLVAGLLALLCFAPSAQANEQSLQIIGWSADEQRFAVRLYDVASPDSEVDDSTPCPGYVDHQGKPFLGSLTLSVYEKGKQLATFPIQDTVCTPPKEAKARLARAKQALAKLGIDLTQKKPGTELTPDKEGRVTVKEGPQAPYTLEAEEKLQRQKVKPASKDKARKAPAATATDDEEEEEDEDPDADVLAKYSVAVFARQGGERRQVFSRTAEDTYSPIAGGDYHTRLHRVWLSPAGKTVVLIRRSIHSNMRSADEALEVMGVLSWP